MLHKDGILLVKMLNELKPLTKKELLQLSLDLKWHKGSTTNIRWICPFCAIYSCTKCLCPPEICNNGASGGYINDIKIYGSVSELPDDMLDKMIGLFKEAIKHEKV